MANGAAGAAKAKKPAAKAAPAKAKKSAKDEAVAAKDTAKKSAKEPSKSKAKPAKQVAAPKVKVVKKPAPKAQSKAKPLSDFEINVHAYYAQNWYAKLNSISIENMLPL